MGRQEEIRKLGGVFFRTTLDMACIADSDSFVLLNDRWTEKLGWSTGELMSRPFFDFVHPDDMDATREAVLKLAEGAELVEFQNRYRAADGTWHELEWNATLEPDLALIVASARDVTRARRDAEERLRLARIFESVAELQASYIERGTSREWWQTAISRLIEVTGSEFGFVGRTMTDEEGSPYLLMLAVTDIAWNEWSREKFEEYFDDGLEFRNLDTLFGYTILTGRQLLSNDPSSDPRARGLPEGHPELRSFAGIPLPAEGGPIGMVGLANRPGGFEQRVIDEIEPMIAMLTNIVATAVAQEQVHRAEDELERLEERVHGLTEYREGREALVATVKAVADQPDLDKAMAIVRTAIGETDESVEVSLFLVDEEQPELMVEFVGDPDQGDPADRESFIRDSCMALAEGRAFVSRPGLELGSCRHVSAGDFATICVPMVAANEEFGLLTSAIPSQLNLARQPQALLAELQEKLELLAASVAQVASRERLVARALKDFLTKLPNRAAFEQLGARLMSRGAEERSPFGVILFDVDSFKQINDTYGHKVGDMALIEVGAAVKGTLRTGDSVARIGGDEFAVVVTSCDGPRLERIAERVCAAARSVDVEAPIRTSVSVGAVLVEDMELDWNRIVEAADAAMYEAKHLGGDQVVVGSPSGALPT